jgi:hypothetical protein
LKVVRLSGNKSETPICDVELGRTLSSWFHQIYHHAIACHPQLLRLSLSSTHSHLVCVAIRLSQDLRRHQLCNCTARIIAAGHNHLPRQPCQQKKTYRSRALISTLPSCLLMPCHPRFSWRLRITLRRTNLKAVTRIPDSSSAISGTTKTNITPHRNQIFPSTFVRDHDLSGTLRLFPAIFATCSSSHPIRDPSQSGMREGIGKEQSAFAPRCWPKSSEFSVYNYPSKHHIDYPT